jgi:hypothetical protein
MSLTRLTLSSGRTRADFIACVASLLDAFACLTFPFVEANPTSVARIYIAAFDPIACIIGYWVIFRRLRNTRPILAEIGFSILVLGTFFVTCQNAVEELRNFNLFPVNQVSAIELDTLLELFSSFSLPIGLAIYAWLIATSPPLRRWLGFMIGIQVIILFADLGAFNIPQLSELGTAVYAVILSLAKALWFLSPVSSNYAARHSARSL